MDRRNVCLGLTQVRRHGLRKRTAAVVPGQITTHTHVTPLPAPALLALYDPALIKAALVTPMQGMIASIAALARACGHTWWAGAPGLAVGSRWTACADWGSNRTGTKKVAGSR